MKQKAIALFFVLFLILPLTAVFAQSSNEGKEPDPESMTTYYMAFLRRGPDRSHDSLTAAKIQEGHMAHINKMAEDKKLVLAGPFLDKGDLRGIFVFNVSSMEEALELTRQDPAVKSGRLAVDILPWYGPAKLREIKW
ncbi:MAG: hypothetical protein HGA37_03105 [Lentimicrobium sp.]|nr:hypothetical protein [Lentimicrobium sp.]